MITRRLLLVLLRSIAAGWLTLCLLALLDRALLGWTAPIVGAKWIATAGLGLDCAALAATGWVVGRLSRPNPMAGVLIFAASLTFWDLSFLVAINVPWLVRLAADTLRDGSYFESFVSTTASQTLLFGCLLAGGLLSRPTAKPVSIVV